MAEWSGGVRPRRRSIPAELENKAMRRMVPDLPEAPGAVVSPQIPGMTPDRTTVPGHEGERPRRVDEAGKRRPLTEYGTAQRIAGVYQPSGEDGTWAPKDFEQAPSAYEELRKVDPRLLTPARPAPGYETDRALAEAEERAALAAGLPEEQEPAAATMLGAAGAAVAPAAPGEISSGIDAPAPPVIAEAQRVTSETGAAVPAEAVANAEAALAPPVIPTDPQGTLGEGGVGQAPSERDAWAQAAPPPGEFTGAAQEVADAPAATGAQDRPGDPTSLVVPDLAGDSAQDSGFGPREDRPGSPVESPTGVHAAPSAAGEAPGAGTTQPVASADAGTRTGTPAADVLRTEQARADLTGGDPNTAAMGDPAAGEGAAISGTAPGGSGVAEWGSADTGLPVAEPFARDVAPDVEPIAPAGGSGAADQRMGIAAGAGQRIAVDPAAAGIVGAEDVVLGAAADAAAAAPAPPADASLAEAVPVAGVTRDADPGPAEPPSAPPSPGGDAAAGAGAEGKAAGLGGAPDASATEADSPSDTASQPLAQVMPPPPRRAGVLTETPEAGAPGGAANAVRVRPAAPQALEETGGGPGFVAPAPPPVQTPPMPDDADMVADLYAGDQGAPSGVPGEAGADSVTLEMEIEGIGGTTGRPERPAPAPSVTAAPVETARGDAPRTGGGLAEDDASFGAAQPVGLDAGTAVETAPAGVDPAVARVEHGAAVADALSAGTVGAAAAPADAVPGNGSRFCPPGFPVKGNAKSHLYHLPHHGSYEQTVPEFCFKTPEAAEAAGFGRVGGRAAGHGASAAAVPYADAVAGDGSHHCPAGYPIKGNADSGIYHQPHQGSYERTVAEFCFKSAAAAEAAGFRATGRKR